MTGIADWLGLVEKWLNSRENGGFMSVLDENPGTVSKTDSGVILVSEIPSKGRKLGSAAMKWFERELDFLNGKYDKVVVLKGCAAEQDFSLFRGSKLLVSRTDGIDAFTLTKLAQRFSSSFVMPSDDVVFPEAMLNDLAGNCFEKLAKKKSVKARLIKSECLDGCAMREIALGFFPSGKAVLVAEDEQRPIRIESSAAYFKRLLVERGINEPLHDSDAAIIEHARKELLSSLESCL